MATLDELEKQKQQLEGLGYDLPPLLTEEDPPAEGGTPPPTTEAPIVPTDATEVPEEVPEEVPAYDDATRAYLEGKSEEQIRTFESMPDFLRQQHVSEGRDIIPSPNFSTLNIQPPPDDGKVPVSPSADLSHQGLYRGNRMENKPADFNPLRDLFAEGLTALGVEGSSIQKNKEINDIRGEVYTQEAMAIYDSIPGYYRSSGVPGMAEIKINYRPVVHPETGEIQLNEDGSPVMEAMEVPRPDTQYGMRLFKNLWYGIKGNVLGAVQEGKFSSNSKAKLDTPRIETSGAEKFIDDLVLVGASAYFANAAVGGAFKLMGVGQKGSSPYARAARYLGGAGAVGVSDTVMAEDGTKGLFITPDKVSKVFTDMGFEIGKTAADDAALLIDSIAFTGGLDLAMRVFRPVGQFLSGKTEGIRRFSDDAYNAKQAESEMILKVMLALDPTIGSVSDRASRRKMQAMSRMFNNHSVMELAIGETTGRIGRDGPTTVLAGAKAYVMETMQAPKGVKYGTEAFDKWVEKEAAQMAFNMMTIARGVNASPNVIFQRTDMAEGVYDLLERSGKTRIPEDVDPSEWFFQQMDTLRQPHVKRKGVLREAIGDAEFDAAELQRQTDELLVDNQLNAELQKNYGPGTTNSVPADAAAVATTMSGEGLDSFIRDWRAVYDAYKNIEGAGLIDPAGLKVHMDRVARNSNRLDSTGDQGRALISDLFRGFRKQAHVDAKEGTNIKGQGVTFETAEELLYNLQDIKYSELVIISRRLENTIKNEKNPELRQTLTDLRNHLLSGDAPKIDEVTGEVLEPAGQLWTQMQAATGEATKGQLQAAKNAFARAKSKWNSTQGMRDLSTDLAEGRSGVNMPKVADAPADKGVADIEVNTASALKDMGQDPTGRSLEAFMYALSDVSEEGRGTVTTYYETLVKREVARALASGDPKQLSGALDAINANKAKLDHVGSTLEADVKRMVQDIEADTLRLGNLTDEAQENLTASTAQLERASTNILERFLNVGASDDLVGNPESVLKKILFGEQAGDRMRELYSQVDRLPLAERDVVRGALRERTTQILADGLRGSTPVGVADGMSIKATMKGKLNSIRQGYDNDVLGAMEVVLGKDTDAFKGFETALKALEQSELMHSIRTSQYSGTADMLSAGKQVEEAVGTGILFLFGYMNPTAAAVRRLTAGQLQNTRDIAQQVGHDVLIAAVSNPIEFGRMIEGMRVAKTPTERRKLAQHFGKIVSHGVGYDIRTTTPDEKGKTYMEQIDQVIPTNISPLR